MGQKGKVNPLPFKIALRDTPKRLLIEPGTGQTDEQDEK